VKVSKKLAIFGFNLCASVFIGFCVYGLLVHMEEEGRQQFSMPMWSLIALGIVACIAGIGYFGNQWDIRNGEESRIARQAGGSNPKKPK